MNFDIDSINCNCPYCKTHGYLWYIPPLKKMWIKIPKNGSGTIKNSFGIAKREQIFGPCLVFLRDPVERFKSLFAHYFIDGARKHLGPLWLSEVGFRGGDKLQFLLDNISQIDKIRQPHHFKTQHSFIPDPNNPNLIYYDLKKLSKFTPKKHNTSSSFSVYLNENQTKFVQQLYQKDVDLFNTWVK